MFKSKNLLIVFAVALYTISCENYYVRKDGINTNYSSGINIFNDTLFFTEVIDLSGNRLVGSDSVFFITDIHDTSFNASDVVGLHDSIYSQVSLTPVNKQPISLSLPGLHAIKNSSQLSFISSYNSADYLFFVNNDGDSVDSYSGFISQNANNNLFSSTIITGVDSVSFLEDVDMSIQIQNNFNFQLEADFVGKSAGQSVINFRFSLPPGDSLLIDSTITVLRLGKKLELTLEDVTVYGWNSPRLIDNSSLLTVNLNIDTCEVKTGKIIPYDSRFEIGLDTITLPYHPTRSHLLGVKSGLVNSELNLNGIDGPFYLIREVSDSNNFFMVDSLLMVQSPNPFVNNIILQDDTLLNEGSLYARYFLRPLAGFPIRLKPHYTIQSSYSVQQEWQENYYEGRLMDTLTFSYGRNFDSNPATSHINDSLILRSTTVVSTLQGKIAGKVKIKDSTSITYSHFKNSYVDTSAWEFPFTGGFWNPNATQISQNQIENTDSSLVGLIIQGMNGDIQLWSNDSCSVKYDEDLKFNQYVSSLVGFSDGNLGYHANTPVAFNQSEALDSLIYLSDSVQFKFSGIGIAVTKFETTLQLELIDNNGSALFTDAVECIMDSTQWESNSFYLPSSKITGQPLTLKIRGDIRGYQDNLLSLEDQLYIQLNASF